LSWNQFQIIQFGLIDKFDDLNFELLDDGFGFFGNIPVYGVFTDILVEQEIH
jgi:hypothetical protein